MKLCEYVDELLSELGVDKVFGIPGSLIMPIWQCLKGKDIVLCSHEQEASYLAVGYAKATRKPVCVITTGGPGVTNCLSGIAAANIDSIPLIYISGRTSISKNGMGVRQEESGINRMIDSTILLSSLTKKSICIDDLNESCEKIREIMNFAVTNRSGAVHISIPVDYQMSECIPSPTTKISCNSKVNHKVEISNRPLFVVGWGCWMSNSYPSVYELARKTNAPVLVSSKAYCCIEHNNKMYLGKLGYGYNQVLDEFIEDYNPDSLYAFGSSLGEKDTSKTVLTKLFNRIPTYIIADDCSYVAHREKALITIHANNLNDFIVDLNDHTEIRTEDEPLIFRINRARVLSEQHWREKVSPNDFMAQSICFIDQLKTSNCVISADAGNHLANVGALINPGESGQLFLDVGLRAMGTGICTIVGMAIADKSKIYIAITGDGSMLMNGNVMHIASELELPIVFVVFNNHSLGRVRIGQSIMNDYRASSIENVDFVSYGNAFGLKTYRFNSLTEVTESFSQILYSKKTSLVEIVTDSDEIPVSVKGNVY